MTSRSSTPNTPRPKLTLDALGIILRETAREWNDDNVPRLGAALAFYSMLSVGPLLLIAIGFAGVLFGHDAVSTLVTNEIRRLIGESGADALKTLISLAPNPNAAKPLTNVGASVIGVVTLIISTTGFFVQLQSALNIIWNVEGQLKLNWRHFLQKRLLSFVMILGIAALFVAALLISAVLSDLRVYVIEGPIRHLVFHTLNLVVSFGVVTALFATIFKVLPDVSIRWRDVWLGAFLTSMLFSLGKLLIGAYLGHSMFASVYGAAGALIVVLLWVYYSAQIVFIGAEFTQVYTRYMGEQIVLKKGRGKEVVNVAKASPKHVA